MIPLPAAVDASGTVAPLRRLDSGGARKEVKTTVWTLGHSTHSWQEFLSLLEAYELQAVADVRRLPGSRRLPQFDQDTMTKALERSGIAYRWFPKLGGRRRALKDSPNTGWRNLSFRGYADYLASEEFAEGLAELIDLAKQERTTLMCAEAVWWRCHRRLIADVLLLKGFEVIHILDATHATPHTHTPPARVVKGKLTYPDEE
jgi:uncharacterized protein (DUF488 family)